MLKKKTTAITLLSVLVLSTASPAFAYVDENGQVAEPSKYFPELPATWMQEWGKPNTVGSREQYIPASPKTQDKMFAGIQPFPGNSCMIQCLTKMFLQSGLKEWGTSSIDVHDELYDQKLWMNVGGELERYANYVEISKNYDGIQLQKSDSPYGSGLQVFDSNEEGYKRIAEEWRKGNYVTAWVYGLSHVVTVDYVDDDGTIYISDTSTKFQTLQGYENGVDGMNVWEPTGNTPKSTESISIIASLKEGKPTKVNGELIKSVKSELQDVSYVRNISRGTWIIDENGIPNMPTDRTWETIQDKIANGEEISGKAIVEGSYDWYENDLASYLDKDQALEDFVSGGEAANSIAKWTEERDSDKSTTLITRFRRGLMGIGVFSAIAGAVFSVLYVIDRLSPVLGGTLIALLTKGRVVTIGSKDYKPEAVTENGKQVRYLTDLSVIFWVAIFGLFSAFIISGLAYQWLSVFLNFVVNFFTALGGAWK